MKRKQIIMTGIIALTMSATGCSSRQGITKNTDAEIRESLPFHDAAENESTDIDKEEQTMIPQENEDNTTDYLQENENSSADILQENDSSITPDDSQKLNISNPDAIFIGGKVRSVSQDTFVISRTLVEDSMVIMPEAGSPDEVLVTVRCSDSTTFEHWTIQGGGAGISRTDAAFSDIKVGDGLEASGTFDGDDFIADKVIIELYN